MINYIFELFSFIVSIAMYFKGDIKLMALWLAATCIFGFSASITDGLYRKYSQKEVK